MSEPSAPPGPVQHTCDVCGAPAHSGFGIRGDDLEMWACAARAPDVEERYGGARRAAAQGARGDAAGAGEAAVIAPATIRELVLLWPSTRAFARDCGHGVSPNLVRQWKVRNRIPGRFFAAIADGAARRGIPGITAELLIRLADARKPA